MLRLSIRSINGVQRLCEPDTEDGKQLDYDCGVLVAVAYGESTRNTYSEEYEALLHHTRYAYLHSANVL